MCILVSIFFSLSTRISCNCKIRIRNKSIIKIGKHFKCRNYCILRAYNGGKILIGNNVFLNDSVKLNCIDKIKIGDNVQIGTNVVFFDHDHDYKNDMKLFVKKEIVIGNNVWIGANCTILKGVIIGDNSVIAAGSIVRENIPSNTLYINKIDSKMYERSKNNGSR